MKAISGAFKKASPSQDRRNSYKLRVATCSEKEASNAFLPEVKLEDVERD